MFENQHRLRVHSRLAHQYVVDSIQTNSRTGEKTARDPFTGSTVVVAQADAMYGPLSYPPEIPMDTCSAW